MIWLSAIFFGLCMIGVHRVTDLDVECGNRDGDYGSNIGLYWPWTPIIQGSFAGCIICFLRAMS